MKTTTSLLIAGIFSVLFFCISCNEKIDPNKSISLQKAYLGGCNVPDSASARNLSPKNDTVLFTKYSDDSLDVYIGLNFYCCAGITSTTRTANDTITLTLTDTCPYGQDCYCRCECYYTWDFIFNDFNPKFYYFRVLFTTQAYGKSKVLKEGIIDLRD